MKHPLFLLIPLSVISCQKEQSQFISGEEPSLRGAFIVNEGGLTAGGAGVSYLDPNGTLTEDLFEHSNGSGLPDDLRSLQFYDGVGYILIRSTGTLKIVELNSFTETGEISGLHEANEMVVGSDGVAYISAGTTVGTIFRVDLNNRSITGVLNTGQRPGRLVIAGNRLFVTIQGGFYNEKYLQPIDIDTWTALPLIEASEGISDLVADRNGMIWVLCSGVQGGGEGCGDEWHMAAKIVTINSMTLEVENVFTLEPSNIHPKNIEISPDGETIYYESEGVYVIPVTEELPGALLISAAFDVMNIDPSGNIWLCDQQDMNGLSEVKKYSAGGQLLTAFTAGVGAREIVVRE